MLIMQIAFTIASGLFFVAYLMIELNFISAFRRKMWYMSLPLRLEVLSQYQNNGRGFRGFGINLSLGSCYTVPAAAAIYWQADTNVWIALSVWFIILLLLATFIMMFRTIRFWESLNQALEMDRLPRQEGVITNIRFHSPSLVEITLRSNGEPEESTYVINDYEGYRESLGRALFEALPATVFFGELPSEASPGASPSVRYIALEPASETA